MIAENENLDSEGPVIVHLVERAGIGRNDLCPCNSGHKYKKCHEKSDKMLLPQELRTLLHLLIESVNGVAVSQKKLDEYPEDAEINIKFDAKNQIWRIVPKRPAPKLILQKKKRIILPN